MGLPYFPFEQCDVYKLVILKCTFSILVVDRCSDCQNNDGCTVDINLQRTCECLPRYTGDRCLSKYVKSHIKVRDVEVLLFTFSMPPPPSFSTGLVQHCSAGLSLRSC